MLRNRDFLLLFAGQGISRLGDGLYTAAVAWLAWTYSHDPGAVAFVAVAANLPTFFATVIGASYADRYDRRRLMIATDLGRAAVVALAPPLLLAGVDRFTRSPGLAWALLAAMMFAVARYVHAHGLRVGLGLAVRSDPPHSPTAMTVAVVDESDTDLGAVAVVSRLAELAASDELVVVYGSSEPTRPRLSANILVTGLRDRLPRHRVVGVRAGPYAGAMDRLATILGDFVEAGAVAIAVAPTAESRGLAAELSNQLRADRVLKMSFTLTRGADLHEVWRRDPPTARGGAQ